MKNAKELMVEYIASSVRDHSIGLSMEPVQSFPSYYQRNLGEGHLRLGFAARI
jgi:hypothetical protein